MVIATAFQLIIINNANILSQSSIHIDIFTLLQHAEIPISNAITEVLVLTLEDLPDVNVQKKLMENFAKLVGKI